MLGINYLKTAPTQYVIHFQGGRVKREGAGLAFFYYQPSSSIAIVPVGSADAPFIFSETTADFQSVTVQGQITFRVKDAKKVASLLNFTVNPTTVQYMSDDPGKLSQRLINLTQIAVRSEISTRSLRDVTRVSDEVVTNVQKKIASNEALDALGLEIMSLTIQAIKPIPEMARALEAEAREALLKQSDNAIYDRRNSAVEQERRIKENELSTEIAVEEKKRTIRETVVAANLAVEAKEQEIRVAQMAGQIKLENDRKSLVAVHAENVRIEADNQAYIMEQTLKPIKALDKEMLQMLTLQNADPKVMVSLAMAEMAKNAGKIGQVSFTPDLMEALMQNKKK